MSRPGTIHSQVTTAASLTVGEDSERKLMVGAFRLANGGMQRVPEKPIDAGATGFLLKPEGVAKSVRELKRMQNC